MKCEDVSNELIAYLDRRANSAERRDVEGHLAACADCRERAEEFRKLWNVLDEMPVLEPSLGFNARVRQSVAAKPRRNGFWWLVPQPRLAFSLALLLALSVWVARMPNTTTMATATEDEDFNAIKDLGVLENYDVLTKFDALSELPQTPLAKPETPADSSPASDDSGGM